MFLLASHVIWGFINGLQGVIRSLNLSGEGEQSEVSYFGKWMKNNCEGAWVSAVVLCSAPLVSQSVFSITKLGQHLFSIES